MGAVLSLSTARANADELAASHDGPRLVLSLGAAALDTLSAPVADDRIGSAGAWIDVAVTVRLRHFVVGGSVGTIGTGNQSELYEGGLAGYAADRGAQEISIAAEAGRHQIFGLGRGFLTESDAPSVELPYVGARLDVIHRTTARGVNLGLSMFARQDLRQEQATAHLTVFTDHEDITYTAGGRTLGMAFSLQFGR